MENQDYQNPKKFQGEDSLEKYDEFFDRFKSWEEIRAERYLC